MRETLDVTFVMAAYNAEPFLPDAIASALAQEGVSVEVIVADDGSRDGTAEAARDFAGRGVRVIEMPQNGGPAAARNAALAEASGRWIAVLDADDLVRPDRMARMIARAESAGADIVVDNLDVATADGASRRMFPEEDLKRIGDIDLATFILSNRIFRSTHNFGYMKPVFRHAFLRAHGLRYDESLRIGEDYVLLASALARGARCTVDPQAGYVYRVRKGSISEVLELGDVEAMQRADAAFLREHALSGAALSAMRKRARSLSEAASYLALLDHIRKRAVASAVATAAADPLALRHLRMPIGVRLRRLARQIPVLRLV